MLSIFAMAAALCWPRANADGSLKLPVSPPVEAGVGVEATSVVVLLAAGPGAGGCAGVEAGAGVEGAFPVDDDAVDEGAGAVLGY